MVEPKREGIAGSGGQDFATQRGRGGYPDSIELTGEKESTGKAEADAATANAGLWCPTPLSMTWQWVCFCLGNGLDTPTAGGTRRLPERTVGGSEEKREEDLGGWKVEDGRCHHIYTSTRNTRPPPASPSPYHSTKGKRKKIKKAKIQIQ